MGRGPAAGNLSFSAEKARQGLLLLLASLPCSGNFNYSLPLGRPRCRSRSCMRMAGDLLGAMPLAGMVGR